MEVARHVQSAQNKKLVIFWQYFKKKVLQLLVCSTDMENIQTFYGIPVMFIVTCIYFFSFSFVSLFLDGLAKVFLRICHHSLRMLGPGSDCFYWPLWQIFSLRLFLL